jgi:Fe2+ transport system protein FeoA
MSSGRFMGRRHGRPQAGNYGYPLVLASRGEIVKVVSLQARSRLESRLVSMGINPGAVLTVLSSGGGGPIIVARDETRLGIDRKTAWHIRVLPERGGNSAPVLKCSNNCWGCSYMKESLGDGEISRTTLEQLSPGQEGEVVAIRRGKQANRRLGARGIHVGTRLEVLESRTRGGITVSVLDGGIVQLGYREGMFIEVEAEASCPED